MTLRPGGDLSRAVQINRALRLDPRNQTARQEMASLPEERRPEERKGGASFIRKFFSKA